MLPLYLATTFLSIHADWLTLKDEDCFGCKQFNRDNTNLSSIGFVNSDIIILGAKNLVLKVNFKDKSSQVYPDEDTSSKYVKDFQSCLDAGRLKDICENYYKVIMTIDNSTVLLCGTSGFNPKCDFRPISDLSYSRRQNVVTGDGICPADPTISLTYTTTVSSDVGFSGTCRRVCNEYAISRMNFQAGSLMATARTFEAEEFLSIVDFVYSFEEGDYVYFLFKETATEEEREHVYSRIGRVCKNDVGSSSPLFPDYLKTFVKARIYCTSKTPGETPFDHDYVGGGFYLEKVLYAVFSGPSNLRTGSLICKYDLVALEKAFEGPYLVHNIETLKWETAPNPEPFQCGSARSVKDITNEVLMNDPIQSADPIFSTEDRLRFLLVNDKIQDNIHYTELFSSTENGDILRVAFSKANMYKVYHNLYKIGKVSKGLSLQGDVVYSMSDNSLTQIPSKYYCGTVDSCMSCLSRYFPSCGWCYGDGFWSCTHRNTCTKSWKSPLDKCEALPRFVEKPVGETVGNGRSVVLKCRSYDTHPFYWTKEGGTLPLKSSVMPDTGYLLLPIATVADNGCYTCNMNNTSGRVKATACITVLDKPRFTPEGEPPSTMTIYDGHTNLLLPCSGKGNPKPVASWKRTGLSLPEGSAVLDNGTLRLIRVMSIDAGEYTCTIQNTEGIATKTVNLQVHLSDDEKSNGTEEQYNGGEMNRGTIIVLSACVFLVILLFSVASAVYIYRSKRGRRNRHNVQYLENDNPIANYDTPNSAQYLIATGHHPIAWSNIPKDTIPLTNLHPTTYEDDEAPPAYTDTSNILPGRQNSSDYHLLSGPFHPPLRSTPPFLYQPPHGGTCCHVTPPPTMATPDPSPSPGPYHASPRFITAVPNDSPSVIAATNPNADSVYNELSDTTFRVDNSACVSPNYTNTQPSSEPPD